jgi:hypothetical protein
MMKAISSLLNEAAIKKFIESKIPKEYRNGMKIPLDGKEEMLLSDGNMFQQTYFRYKTGDAGEREDNLIGMLINMILSWSPEEQKKFLKDAIEAWFLYLNRIDSDESNLHENRVSMILLILHVLTERQS